MSAKTLRPASSERAAKDASTGSGIALIKLSGVERPPKPALSLNGVARASVISRCAIMRRAKLSAMQPETL
jgi:hypothetical protein